VSNADSSRGTGTRLPRIPKISDYTDYDNLEYMISFIAWQTHCISTYYVCDVLEYQYAVAQP
jgi:hypothetical protein